MKYFKITTSIRLGSLKTQAEPRPLNHQGQKEKIQRLIYIVILKIFLPTVSTAAIQLWLVYINQEYSEERFSQ